MNIAIIPARGGSKGIPRKNLQLVGDHSLLAHAIHQAQQARCVDAIYVSTEDDEIAAHARAEGAEVIDRPAELATDTASTDEVISHALSAEAKIAAAHNLLVLQPTSPLRLPADIDGCCRVAAQQPHQAVTSVTDHDGFVWSVLSSGYARPVYYNPLYRPRKQEYSYAVENGAIYLVTPRCFQTHHTRCPAGLTGVYRMPQRRSVQVDTLEDLELARDLYRISKERT